MRVKALILVGEMNKSIQSKTEKVSAVKLRKYFYLNNSKFFGLKKI